MMKSMKKKVVGAMLGLCVAAAAVPAATSFAATKSTGVTQTAEHKPGQRNGQKNGQKNGQQAPGENGKGRGGRMRSLPVDELVQDGVISKETGEKIQKWMEEKRTERQQSAGKTSDGTTGEKKARPEKPANAADGTQKEKKQRLANAGSANGTDTSAGEKKARPERNSDGTKKEKSEKSTGSTDASTSDSKTAGKSASGSANGGQKAGRSDGAGARGGFSDDMLKELVDAGILNQKEANAIQEKYSKGNDAA